MHIAMLAYGTRGDIEPMMVLGYELQARGHSVALTVNEDLAGWAAGSGLDIVSMPPDVTGAMRSEEVMRSLAAGKTMSLGRQMGRIERDANDAVSAACFEASRGADVILSTLLTVFRGWCVEQATGIPCRPVVLYPAHPTAREACIAAPVGDLGSARLNRASYRLFYGVWWRQTLPLIREMAATAGMAPPRTRPRVEQLPSLHAYSPCVSPPAPDWPGQHEVVGWLRPSAALRECLGERELPADLGPWLDDGPPPIFVGFGSVPLARPAAMVEAVTELTAERGLRAIVGPGLGDAVAGRRTAPHVYAAPVIDHDRVLPRCAAAVHHGGAGTTGAVVRAGIPSVVASVFGDQPLWGRKISQCGAGVTVPLRKLTATRLAASLDQVLEPACVERARALGARVRQEDGAKGAAAVVERWAEVWSARAPELSAEPPP